MPSHMFENVRRRCSELWKSLRESITSVYSTVTENCPSLSTILVASTELLLIGLALCTVGFVGYISWRLFRAFITGMLFFLLFVGGSLVLLDVVAFDGGHIAAMLDFFTESFSSEESESRKEDAERGGGKGGDIPSFMKSIP